METSEFDDDDSSALRQSLVASIQTYKDAMARYDTAAALAALNSHVSYCNGYAERQRPWELAKEESQRAKLATVLYHMVESCAQISVLLSPVTPNACAKIQSQLRLPELSEKKLPDLQWGLIPSNHEVGKPKPVFPRIQLEE